MIEIKNRYNGKVIATFDVANLSGADLRGADLSDAYLRDAHLRNADLCRADLCDADLCNAHLCRADLCRADLRDADLRDADLRDADLRRADLRGANLRGADLSGADLRGAEGLPVAPIIENIDAKILAAISAGGCKLDMSSWHTCGSTHCRAGWAITLAGKAGKELERKTSSDTAGQLIYMASRPGIPVPDFYADNETAMKSIREDAAKYSTL